jgi:hypothetical protein
MGLFNILKNKKDNSDTRYQKQKEEYLNKYKQYEKEFFDHCSKINRVIEILDGISYQDIKDKTKLNTKEKNINDICYDILKNINDIANKYKNSAKEYFDMFDEYNENDYLQSNDKIIKFNKYLSKEDKRIQQILNKNILSNICKQNIIKTIQNIESKLDNIDYSIF